MDGDVEGDVGVRKHSSQLLEESRLLLEARQ